MLQGLSKACGNRHTLGPVRAAPGSLEVAFPCLTKCLSSSGSLRCALQGTSTTAEIPMPLCELDSVQRCTLAHVSGAAAPDLEVCTQAPRVRAPGHRVSTWQAVHSCALP